MAQIFDQMEWVIQVEQNCKLPQAVTLEACWTFTQPS